MSKKRIYIILGICIALIGISIFAYFYLLEQKKPSVQPLPQTPKKETAKIPEPEAKIPTFSYDASNLRDPFAPLIVKKEQKKGESALESYDIEEIKLSGIVHDKKGSMALLYAPDGRFYIVRQNDRIGDGIVTKIGKDYLEIKEYKKTYTGGATAKVKYLKLRPEE